MPEVTVTASAGEPASPKAPPAPALPKGWFEFTTADGKGIVASETLTVLEEMDLSAALEVSHISNPVWMQWATLAGCVRMIDGDKLARPRTEAELKVIISRVGDDGMRQLMARWAIRMTTLAEQIKAQAKN